MTRRTPEALLISAIINTGDLSRFRSLQIDPDCFDGHRQEFDWISAYVRRFDRVPSPAIVGMKFPDFTYVQDELDLEWAAEEVVTEYASRRLTGTLSDALDLLDKGLVAEAYRLTGIPSPIQGTAPVDGLEPIIDTRPRDAISVPWPTWQSCTQGIDAGELWYVAARPSQGKSAVLLYATAHALVQGRNVVFYSMEMSAKALQARLYTILAPMLGIPRVTHSALHHGRMDALEYRTLAASIKEALPGSFAVYSPSMGSCTPAVINARAGDYDLSVVDYMGLMRSTSGKAVVEDWRVLAQVSNELKQITLSQNTRVLAASQVNREGDAGRRRKAPRLKNLAGSDALAQDGDGVITMNRWCSGALHVSLEKNRNGESAVSWYAMFDPEVGVFTEINRQQADALADMDGDDE